MPLETISVRPPSLLRMPFQESQMKTKLKMEFNKLLMVLKVELETPRMKWEKLLKMLVKKFKENHILKKFKMLLVMLPTISVKQQNQLWILLLERLMEIKSKMDSKKWLMVSNKVLKILRTKLLMKSKRLEEKSKDNKQSDRN